MLRTDTSVTYVFKFFFEALMCSITCCGRLILEKSCNFCVNKYVPIIEAKSIDNTVESNKWTSTSFVSVESEGRPPCLFHRTPCRRLDERLDERRDDALTTPALRRDLRENVEEMEERARERRGIW